LEKENKEHSIKLSNTARNSTASRRTSRLPVTSKATTTAEDQQQIQQQFNQLVAEVRMLEAYYQEIVNRQQSVSAALLDTRAALDALEVLSKSENNELLVPVGGGTLIFASAASLKKMIVSVGAGVAIEKDLESARSFLQLRRQELEKAISSLENQRKEIGSRLEVGRSTIQRITEAVK
jgi:prefoldin alpha subunit